MTSISNQNTNYDPENIEATVNLLKHNELHSTLMVDCSHGNSNKDYKRQTVVVDSLCEQMNQGNKHICGVMVESNLVAGKQPLHEGKNLIYGQSVTDACIDWEETKLLLEKLAKSVKQRRKAKEQAI